MKALSQLLSAIPVIEVIGSDDKQITDVVSDSRRVTTGSLFVAVRGTQVDGHTFIPLLQYSGVAAIVCEELPEFLETSITYIRVANSAVALGHLASEWYDNPSRQLKLVGVTGTNGKTTTATLIYEMARLMGYKAGLLSTVCNYIDTEAVPTSQTTPDPLTINALLRRMVDNGCLYASMEVSSHAAHQHRIAGLHFTGGIFTNLTRDHLDYHKTVEAYLQAKKSFFDDLPSTAFALTNADDKTGQVMLQNTLAKKYTYSLRTHADFVGRVIESRLDGTSMSFNGREVEVLFTGRFNAYNLTAVYAASVLIGWPVEQVLVAMSRLVPVAGRFQAFHSPKGFTAIVDYAHTPDAVVNVLQAIREVVGTRGSIITVVGAGGNRDKGKRPIMAKEAALRSDRLILTSDNPRDEEPADIIRDMEEGLDIEGRKKTLSIADRREAIRTAAAIAQPGDVILIAGKGHEDYQEIKGVKHHFDDREVVKEFLL
ncbi:UDP-N-acetylmuramoyl-L-alanyl-D-glutamate--2,6-diaminopimelate ligase [Muribaculaceae bacterium Isolate-042 (Harlan)]|jgi:UDP-N-acetylmuramoyl-L-alanyl-D-glutamate--2,6-diaminopimelate ligase|uniref:UDP-N-acetylmuramoyl-L-alanyl-D-glutamate--2, 6-diaminopimelate ligase n=1 Tax=Muribaculum intestinale TaxID=1796646 RepID=UPI000F4A4635|nr:UDP-N-acetylmuramoyl-L-alanyl-D-glutamate--2,6-diaminopimelate ligase [Muribaculum intestinale]MCX4368305.1 UDP-N-acetylmuramoyl-L-alanyl-D-glutamate--2,6-diaminopimelate ligase [Duncaniella sp.]ROS82389.1 UDP-N-acetylmuramoyl-L-alanyl-D-glutamate--2,6-diaminopimelate ligase [Muribaculaceae bacterium Isolate-042 (Harlan)]ROT11222.1 UDP-N-acetylmuramoyl-L-alanyl-D-glutamate--2,6-diaminopimelate ligase [Muribaculaceae bacterium Isolate-100 (HZI)]RXE67231.1 UDP-N-acetylmuramoyl-L-alanyl-D-gluta